MNPLTEQLGSTVNLPAAKAASRHAISLQVKGENVCFADAQDFGFATPAAAQEFGRAVVAAALKLYRKADAADRDEES